MIGAVVLRNEKNELIFVGFELMDLKEAAWYLQVCYETVRRLAQAGKFPAVKVGGVWRVYELEAWLDKQRVGGASNKNGRENGTE